MKSKIKFWIFPFVLVILLSLFALPAAAAEDVCTDFDDAYECICSNPSWSGFQVYEQGDDYTSYIDVCNNCFTEYIYKVWDSHVYEERTVNGKRYNVCQNCLTGYLIEDDGNGDAGNGEDSGGNGGSSGEDSGGNGGSSGGGSEGDGGSSGDDSCIHDFKTTVVPPNCEERGYTWYECQLCDYAFQGDFKDVTDHSYEHVMTVQPTCTKSGYAYYTCKYCGVPPSAEVGYTPPLGHSWAAVSSEIGEDNMITIKSECTRCHVTKEEVHETAAGQAQNWLLTAIRGTSAGLIDSYETLANGIEVGGITLGEVITAALIVVAIVAVIAVVVKFVG